MPKIIISNKTKETREKGKELAENILKNKEEKAFVLALKGNLGGGKTAFVQGLAEGLGIKENVVSPTFVIFRKFKISSPDFKYFYHFDCYRIKNPKEVLNLGFKKIIENPRNIVAVEWAEKIEKILPENTLTIEFEFLEENKRKITFNSEKF